ncbi:MAG: hypothetical protein ACTTH8_04850 [Treponema sp.]
MSVTNYKCPACGAPISFNPKVGGFKCEFCFSEHTEEALTAYLESLKNSSAENNDEQLSHEYTEETDGAAQKTIKSYQCNNCGAEVIVGDTSTAAFCYYCHSPVILTDRLKGDFKPDFLIPFAIDKKTAVKKFLDWAGKKWFVPGDFTNTMQQEKITGMYLPYWQADIAADVDYHAIGTCTTYWTDGDYNYTKVDTYQIDRSGTVLLNNLQKFAFSPINEFLINSIEPYNQKSIKPFSAGYLAGFFAENYTENKDNVTPELVQRAKDATAAIIQNTTPCTTFEKRQDNTQYNVQEHRYILLPSWILTYIYKGKAYVFAVNGQTGKAAGELPFNKKKAFFTALGLGTACSVLLMLGGYFIW